MDMNSAISAEAKRVIDDLGLRGRLAWHVDDFAVASGLGRTSVYAAIKTGQLKARKAGGRTLILDLDGREFLTSLPEMQAA